MILEKIYLWCVPPSTNDAADYRVNKPCCPALYWANT